jgi:hypothetical protein
MKNLRIQITLFAATVIAATVMLAALPTLACAPDVCDGTPPPSPPSLGWIYGRYLDCSLEPPHGQPAGYGCFVNVRAHGVNVRYTPNGPVFLALTNGTRLIPLASKGSWVLVAVECDLVRTGLWSDTAGFPLVSCAWALD